MTIATPRYEEITPTLSTDNRAATEAPVSSAKETVVPSQLDNFSFSMVSLSGMTKTPVSVSDFVAKTFSVLKNVQAVLAGESRDILHVWIMIDEWSAEVRKQVYAVQRKILKQLHGLHFDFYVVDLLPDTRPEEMVSDIPVIFNRANQEPTPVNC